MGKAFERRMSVEGLEVRDSTDGVTLTGYASTFNQPYDMGWYRETVDPAAFKRTLKSNPDVRLLINHDGLPLARSTAPKQALGYLGLDDTDAHGLKVTAILDPTDPDVQRIVPKMRSGVLTNMSFGFRTNEDDWSKDMTARTLRDLDLHNGDVSVVTYPANPNTTVGVRAAGRNIDAVASALRCLQSRAASDEDIASVLARALGYFTAIDNIVDSAQGELANALGIPNPDMEDAEHQGMRAAPPYGDVAYADPGYQDDGKKRYPIDTAEHCRAAWSYINQKSNQTPYTAEQLADIMGRIKAAAKRFGIDISDDAGRQSLLADAERRKRLSAHLG